MAHGILLIPHLLEKHDFMMDETLNQRREASIVKRLKPRKPAVNAATMDGEKINGRKRHIFVDTQENSLFVCVLPAHVSDSDGAYDLLEVIRQRYPTITMMWADGAYMANVEFFADAYTITVEITKRPHDAEGFVGIPRRWVVERTFAWRGRYRVLGKEYTHRAEYSETAIYAASIHRMVNKLHPNPDKIPPYQSKLKNISDSDAVFT